MVGDERLIHSGYPRSFADLYLLDRLNVILDLHDRLIAATALRLNAPMLTRDSLIAACPEITCIW